MFASDVIFQGVLARVQIPANLAFELDLTVDIFVICSIGDEFLANVAESSAGAMSSIGG